MISNFKTPNLKDRKHLEFVSSLNCAVTASDVGVQAHHLLRDDMGRIIRGTGRRAQDNFVIPLRHDIHTELHLYVKKTDNLDANETEYLKKKGIIYPVELALIIHQNTGDELFCNRVTEAWRNK